MLFKLADTSVWNLYPKYPEKEEWQIPVMFMKSSIQLLYEVKLRLWYIQAKRYLERDKVDKAIAEHSSFRDRTVTTRASTIRHYRDTIESQNQTDSYRSSNNNDVDIFWTRKPFLWKFLRIYFWRSDKGCYWKKLFVRYFFGNALIARSAG